MTQPPDDAQARIRALVMERGRAELAVDTERVAEIDDELERLGVRRVPPPQGRMHLVEIRYPEDWVGG